LEEDGDVDLAGDILSPEAESEMRTARRLPESLPRPRKYVLGRPDPNAILH
jgi:hypothetical protein